MKNSNQLFLKSHHFFVRKIFLYVYIKVKQLYILFLLKKTFFSSFLIQLLLAFYNPKVLIRLF